MAIVTGLPTIATPIFSGNALARPYYVYLRSLGTAINALNDSVNALESKSDSASGSTWNPNINVTGNDSISAKGTLGQGYVYLSLENDVASPGFTQYYGSDTTGAKGWFNVSDTLAVTSYLTKTVADTGVTTFDLADAGNTATGTLQAITVDTKGRVSGTTDATIMGTDGHIAVANGNASAGRPTIDLDAAMVALIDFLVAVSPSPRVTSDGSYRVTDSGAYRVTA